MLRTRLAQDAAFTATVDANVRNARRKSMAQAVEVALSNIVSNHRIVSVLLPSGGQLQLCVRLEEDAVLTSRRGSDGRRERSLPIS